MQLLVTVGVPAQGMREHPSHTTCEGDAQLQANSKAVVLGQLGQVSLTGASFHQHLERLVLR